MPDARETARFPTHRDISKRAYEIYIEEGRVDGRAGEHWSRAEHELTKGSGARAHKSGGSENHIPGETELDELRDGGPERQSPRGASADEGGAAAAEIDPVEEASRESFPASDSPAWIAEKSPAKSNRSKKGAAR